MRFFLKIFLLVVLLALPFILKPYAVTQTSMDPTLADGDIILVDRLSLHLFPPQRGEIVVLRNPHKIVETDVKRVIGLPGEKVQVRNTDIVLTHADGREEIFASSTLLGGGERHANGLNFTMQLGPHDYFLLGDNRESSVDSRFFGAAQPPDFIGRALLRIWPLQHISIL